MTRHGFRESIMELYSLFIKGRGLKRKFDGIIVVGKLFTVNARLDNVNCRRLDTLEDEKQKVECRNMDYFRNTKSLNYLSTRTPQLTRRLGKGEEKRVKKEKNILGMVLS